MPLIRKTPEFQAKIQAHADKKLAAKKAELEQKELELLLLEHQLRQELQSLDPEDSDAREELRKIQEFAAKNGIPIIKFFSISQNNLILQMIRALRLNNVRYREIFNAYEPETFRETEEILGIIYDNNIHLQKFMDLGEIEYKEQYTPQGRARSKSSKNSKEPELIGETPRAFEQRINDFIANFAGTKSNLGDRDGNGNE